jgi:hypothetical protein
MRDETLFRLAEEFAEAYRVFLGPTSVRGHKERHAGRFVLRQKCAQVSSCEEIHRTTLPIPAAPDDNFVAAPQGAGRKDVFAPYAPSHLAFS